MQMFRERASEGKKREKKNDIFFTESLAVSQTQPMLFFFPPQPSLNYHVLTYLHFTPVHLLPRLLFHCLLTEMRGMFGFSITH